MTRHLATCLVIAALTTVSAGPAAAAFGDVIFYDTVDAVEFTGSAFLVTGIIQGQSAPSTTSYRAGSSSSDPERASLCQRLALLAMSKPGKFQFVIKDQGSSTNVGCKLILRAP